MTRLVKGGCDRRGGSFRGNRDTERRVMKCRKFLGGGGGGGCLCIAMGGRLIAVPFRIS